MIKLLALVFVNFWLLVLTSTSHPNSVFIVGSINADLTFPLEKLPQVGETVVSNTTDYHTVAGGKGANQAVSCSRHCCPTFFSCNFGNDANAEMLENVLIENQVNLQYCHRSNKPSGLGLVFLQSTGAVSAIVVGGANAAWPIPDTMNILNNLSHSSGIACIMLQMEIPHHINQLYAETAYKLGIPVFQDVGGEERYLSDDYLKLLTYLSPNLTELQRLSKMPVSTEMEIILAAKSLQKRGAKNILITLGSNGSLLLTQEGDIMKQNCYKVDHVIDETGAGDNYRAGFVVAYFIHKLSIQESMSYAAAAGAVAVTKAGAIPSCSTRKECENLLMQQNQRFLNLKGGAAAVINANHNRDHHHKNDNHVKKDNDDDEGLKSLPLKCPWKFASRLNSMKDRWDLMSLSSSSSLPSSSSSSSSLPVSNVLSWIERQGHIKGLDLIDFNYPQHLTSPPPRSLPLPSAAAAAATVTDETIKVNNHNHDDHNELESIKKALQKANLKCGAICLRFPKIMQLGAYTHPSKEIRDQAIQLTKDSCEWAIALGSNEVVVWSAYCGYDYSFQADYNTIYQQIIDAFQEICDDYPTVKISLEYKPTDENTRFFAVPSTAAAILLTQDVNRDNFGLTLDFGHCLMAGENPAQSVASVVRHTSRNDGNKGKNKSNNNIDGSISSSRSTSSTSSSNNKSNNKGNNNKNDDSASATSNSNHHHHHHHHHSNRYINKLFGVQLGDGYGRLGAEDGLAFGSIHPIAALEFIYYLITTNYQGHIYFDTFPRNEDPVRECEYNIRVVKRMYAQVIQLLKRKDLKTGKNVLKEYMRHHDAMSVLELLEPKDHHDDDDDE